MSEFVRVRTENGMEVSVSRVHAETTGAKVIDGPALRFPVRVVPATRKDGRPVLPRTDVSKKVAAKKSASKKAASSTAATPTSSGVAATPEEASE